MAIKGTETGPHRYPGGNHKPHKPVPVIRVKPKPTLGGEQQDAFDLFMSILESYGFDGNQEIARVVKGAILDGTTSPEQLDLIVRDTDAWRTRFAGNEKLKNAGANVLTVGEYLSVEKAMSQVMKQAGLPAGFYDDPADFADFIGKQVSASELQVRVTSATDLVNREDQSVRDQLASIGMSQGDVLAMYMDPVRALPLLQQKYQGVLIGAAARRSGLTGNQDYAEHLSTLGVNEQQAIQGYGTIGEIAKPLSHLGDLYGQQYTQADAEKEVFEGGSSTKRKKLASQERGAFSGDSGTNQTSLTKSATGSY